MGDSLIHTLNVHKSQMFPRKKKCSTVFFSVLLFSLRNGFSACITNYIQAQISTGNA